MRSARSGVGGHSAKSARRLRPHLLQALPIRFNSVVSSVILSKSLRSKSTATCSRMTAGLAALYRHYCSGREIHCGLLFRECTGECHPARQCQDAPSVPRKAAFIQRRGMRPRRKGRYRKCSWRDPARTRWPPTNSRSDFGPCIEKR
jgi:hypothetical protein